MKGKKIITVVAVVCLLSALLAVPAFASVTEFSGDGYSLYNGYVLPVLPDVDTSVFSYVSILYRVQTGKYTLYMCNAPFEYLSTSSDIRTTQATRAYVFDYNNGSWEVVYSDITMPADFRVDYDTNYIVIAFANYTAYTETGEVFYTQDESYSLQGMNVIEWDGNTEGLYNPAGSALYKIDNYLSEPSTAYSVFYDDDYSKYLVNSRIAYNSSLGANGWALADRPSSAVSIAVASVEADNSLGGESGLYFYKAPDGRRTMCFAYRPVETPPDEGGGDDGSQPPCGG